MTKTEFAQGWKLLILQPWGWRYRSLTAQSAMTEETKTQLEFYFDKLKWAHPDAWLNVANLYAEGEEWPSVRALRTSLLEMNRRYVRGLPDGRTTTYEPMPEGFLTAMAKVGKAMR